MCEHYMKLINVMNPLQNDLIQPRNYKMQNIERYLCNGRPKMTMDADKFQLFRMCLDSVKKPLQLLISNPKFGVLVTSCNISMNLRTP